MFALALPIAMLQSTTNPWENQVFYQIFPRSYRDSSGDRTGDFRGIEQGLPTIQKLGCTAILINPIQNARCYHNYFATDFKDVDPSFGTLSEFDHLIQTAHQRKLKVVLDMEPQYVAVGHPWFTAALATPNSPEAQYLASRPQAGGGTVNWYSHEKFDFASLNLNHPDVVRELKSVFEFWSARGVDGYRIDHMMDDLDFQGKSINLFRDLWTPIETEVKRDYPGTFFVGEQADWDAYRSPVDMFARTPTDACFNFRLRNALVSLRKGTIVKELQGYKWFTQAGRTQLTFLENHDMIRFASLEPDPRKQRAAAALMALAKGTPILYYGQELGMKGEQTDVGSDANDLPVRLAYRWGKSLDAKGTATWYRLAGKGPGPWSSTRYSSDRDGTSLEEQENDPRSLFNWYRQLIALRLSSAALGTGTQEVLDLESQSVLAFRRKLGNESVLVLANLSDHPAKLAAGKVGEGKDLLNRSQTTAKKPLSFRPWQVRVVVEKRTDE